MWAQGKALTGMSLWGIPVIWWGRAGKVSAFLGGLTVVLDVIGPDRIREFGMRLKGAPTERYKEHIAYAIAIPAALFAVLRLLGVLEGLPRSETLVPFVGLMFGVVWLVLSPPVIK